MTIPEFTCKPFFKTPLFAELQKYQTEEPEIVENNFVYPYADVGSLNHQLGGYYTGKPPQVPIGLRSVWWFCCGLSILRLFGLVDGSAWSTQRRLALRPLTTGQVLFSLLLGVGWAMSHYLWPNKHPLPSEGPFSVTVPWKDCQRVAPTYARSTEGQVHTDRIKECNRLLSDPAVIVTSTTQNGLSVTAKGVSKIFQSWILEEQALLELSDESLLCLLRHDCLQMAQIPLSQVDTRIVKAAVQKGQWEKLDQEFKQQLYGDRSQYLSDWIKAGYVDLEEIPTDQINSQIVEAAAEKGQWEKLDQEHKYRICTQLREYELKHLVGVSWVNLSDIPFNKMTGGIVKAAVGQGQWVNLSQTLKHQICEAVGSEALIQLVSDGTVLTQDIPDRLLSVDIVCAAFRLNRWGSKDWARLAYKQGDDLQQYHQFIVELWKRLVTYREFNAPYLLDLLKILPEDLAIDLLKDLDLNKVAGVSSYGALQEICTWKNGSKLVEALFAICDSGKVGPLVCYLKGLGDQSHDLSTFRFDPLFLTNQLVLMAIGDNFFEDDLDQVTRDLDRRGYGSYLGVLMARYWSFNKQLSERAIEAACGSDLQIASQWGGFYRAALEQGRYQSIEKHLVDVKHCHLAKVLSQDLDLAKTILNKYVGPKPEDCDSDAPLAPFVSAILKTPAAHSERLLKYLVENKWVSWTPEGVGKQLMKQYEDEATNWKHADCSGDLLFD